MHITKTDDIEKHHIPSMTNTSIPDFAEQCKDILMNPSRQKGTNVSAKTKTRHTKAKYAKKTISL